ncbi:MAG: hypothetical protein R3F55_17030 [Alphaproteobacteria bacterium]
MSDKSKVQGEGDYQAARRYRKDATEFAQSGAVEDAAEKARKAIEGPAGEALRQAERDGKARAKGEDPALRR